MPVFYDPLIGKLIVHGGDRTNTVLLGRIIEMLHIEGPKTKIPALLGVLSDGRFLSGHYDTGLLGK